MGICRQLISPLTLSLRFNSHFPGEPGLVSFIGTKDDGSGLDNWSLVSRYRNVFILDFIGAKDDGGGGDNWSCKTCKAPVKSPPPTNQHLVFLQARCPSCHPTNSVNALEIKAFSTSMKWPRTKVMQWLHDAWSLWCRGDVSQSVTFAHTYPEISSKSFERLIGRQRSRRSLLRRFLAATHPPQEYTVNRKNWSGFEFGF